LVEANDVFPSEQLLDHIPLLIGEIASYLSVPTDNEIAANAAVMEKARELGLLRHEQHASVHQLLHEYELLGEVLETFLIDETARLGLRPAVEECFQVQHRLTRAVRVLMRTTVDTFVSQYTTTIREQTERIQSYNRAASHELRSPIGTLMFASALDVPSQQRVDLTALATEVTRQIEGMAAARHVTLSLAPDLPTIVADPARVELVLLNIISNAIKYSNAARTDSLVEVCLGLAIVHDCVQALGGSIRCESVNGQGTTFFITLPAASPEARRPAPDHRVAASVTVE
jgi:signal transduction histidine kinase